MVGARHWNAPLHIGRMALVARMAATGREHEKRGSHQGGQATRRRHTDWPTSEVRVAAVGRERGEEGRGRHVRRQCACQPAKEMCMVGASKEPVRREKKCGR